MPASLKEIKIDFADCSGGMNTANPPNSIRANQVQLAKNVMLTRKGFKRCPGFAGLSTSPTFGERARLLGSYFRSDGDSILIGVAGGKVYSIDKSTNAATELMEITGDGEAWGDSFQDKYFIANGTNCIKIEGSSAYKLGITPPSGCGATAVAGGSLAAGDYVIYVSYARSTNLYSYAESVGTITLSGGNGTLRITIPNSTDPQVTDKVIWVLAPGDSNIYYYGHTGDNTTTSIDITSNSAQDTTKNYRILGEQSVAPSALQGLIIFNQSLYGWINNVLYKSLPATTVYDLERWPDITYTFPYKILSLFDVGDGHLYVNTNRGVYRLPNGDMDVPYQRITKRLYFKYPRTVARTDGLSYVIGLTNDGVRTFDGNGFSIDLSKDVKNYIDNIYNSGSSFVPCGVIYNRDIRTEYRLSFCDKTIAITSNNRQLVLNMDTLYWANNIEYNAAWEIWDGGFSYATVDSYSGLYMLQTTAVGSQVIKDNLPTTTDINIYNTNANFITTATAKTKDVKSRVVVPDITYILTWEGLWLYYKLRASAKADVYVYDELNLNDEYTVATTNNEVSTFGTAVFGASVFTTSQPRIQRCKPMQTIKGSAFYFRFYQTGDDKDMEVYEITAYGTMENSRFT